MSVLMDILLFTLSILAVFLFKRILARKQVNPGGFPYPPGPKPLPLVGNIRGVPVTEPWITYTQWGKTYGDLMYLHILGQDIVIVNSEGIANDLFEKRSKLYSDRPILPMADMTGWDFNAGLMPYGDRWRANRRLFHQAFRQDAALSYRPLQLAKVHEYLRTLLESPEDFAINHRTLSASIVMKAVYGYDVESKADRYVEIAEKAVSLLSECAVPGAFAVNSLPILRYLPEWFPGASFHRFSRECRRWTGQMQNTPLDFAKSNMAAGVGVPCIVSDLLERHAARGGSHEQEEVIKNVAATTYAAGADTTVSSSMSAMLAMVLYPAAQKKAQAEIDRVVGASRLPTYEDRASLPYVEAFYREVMRWHPVLPLGVFHATTEDDIYEGYYIPKGAAVFPNTWAMTHDERKYQDPNEFKPERFLTDGGTLNADDTILAFGFGRRICPGRHLADATVWAMIVSILAAFNVAKAKDEVGNEIEVEDRYTEGLLVHPQPFRCSITPRSKEVERLVLDTTANDV